jgi:drug/metabolite transporter (DMT)-like permease
LKRHWLAIAALFFTAAAWGATFPLIKNVLRHIAPEPFIFWRFTLAGLILMAVAARGRVLRREIVRPGLLLGVLVFAGYWLQTRGLLTISASRSAFLTGLYVVMVPFFDGLVYGMTIPRRAWAASILAVAGTAVLIGGFDAQPNLGDFLTFICAAVFALHVVLSARFSAAHSPSGIAAVQVLFVGLLAAPPSVFAPRMPMTAEVAIVIISTAVVTTALAFAALMWGQARVTATEAAVILSFEPVAASITAVLWDHEPISVAFICGALLILAAMVISQLPDATMRVDAAHSRHQ